MFQNKNLMKGFERKLPSRRRRLSLARADIVRHNSGIGLYRDVWIAAIASSTTSLATRTAAICVRFQGRRTCTSRVRHNADYVPYAKIRFDL